MIEHIIRELRTRNFQIAELTLDARAYHAYMDAAQYRRLYPGYYSWNVSEKSLEHFVAAQVLGLTSYDVYIDIASEHSPAPEIYARLFGCVCYRQDLAYPAGLHGDRISGDAAAMPVPDGFASKMALHCSFEHFERDADIRFVREINRVLRPGGKVCIAPLYLFDKYAILTDPVVSVREKVVFDHDAVVYCKPGWGNRHGRFCDPNHLETPVKKHLGNLRLTIYRVKNARAMDSNCYMQFAAVITKS
jgi:SAM-dependent methyltransferase